ncbi:MAG: hypothetical protein JNM89_01340 [Hyphomicrobiaceae bacterium]|nr:hypothetical protein [Hyphomicrobiaceae bacterium]
MNHEFSFRRFACLYLDAYCADHVQRQVLSETQVTQARALFHEFLAALDAPVLVTGETVSKNTRHVLCAARNLRCFVGQFARDFLGYSDIRKRRSSK